MEVLALYSCPGCGSQMLFDIKGQQLKCGRCDRTMSIAEADEKEARQAGNSFSADLYSCPTCGAEIRALNTAAAAFCSYCGSSVMLNKRTTEMESPESLIPFKITREECFEKFQGILKKSFCMDHRLKKNITADSFRGIYVPYHMYKASVMGNAELEGTETRGDTTYYYKTTVFVDHRYKGIMHDASKEMPDSVSERIPVSEDSRDLMVPFSPAYLSGFYADTADTDPDTYINYAKAEAVHQGLQDTLPTLKDDNLSYSTGSAEKELMKFAEAEYTGDTMIPVWFMSMKSGKRVLYAVQNAVTGEMWADIPMDISRFAIVTAALAVVLFFVFNLFLTLRPEMVMVAAMLLAVFAQLAVNGRRSKVWEKEEGKEESQRGEFTVQEQVSRMKKLQRLVKRQKSGGAGRYIGTALAGVGSFLAVSLLSGVEYYHLYKWAAVILTVVMGFLVLPIWGKQSKLPLGSVAALTAMVAGCILVLLDPFHSADMPVYIVTAAIMAGVIWESVALMKLYNRSCSNPLPQFESHQGGEDRA